LTDMREFVRGLHHVASTPSVMYNFVKRIDGDTRPGGSIIMAKRVQAFCGLVMRQMFYEPLFGYDSIIRSLDLMRRISETRDLPFADGDQVQIAFDIFASASAAPLGRLDVPKAGERAVGVHAVRAVGWVDGGEGILFQNSWGIRWGDKGYGTVSREYLNRYLRDVWLSRNARYGFTPFDRDRLAVAVTSREIASIWWQENPRRRRWVRHRNLRWRLYTYETVSIEDDVPVTVIELRTGQDIRLGWAFLFHEGGGTAVLKELFVWPSFRRHGYGRFIENEAVAIARARGSASMQLYLHEADALPTNRRAGREFGTQAGYQWRWRRTSLPNLEAIGEKML
jgi:GNAT superfamily N-acetyltransferase